MANSADFLEHVVDLARAVGPADARRMFGGHGVYVDGVIVGLVVDDTLYLKTDAETLPAFRARGLEPFTFEKTKSGEVVITSYVQAPEEALDSPAQMLEWARLAYAAALRSSAKKKKK